MTVPDDEFALLAENAAEYGIPWSGRPAVRREAVAVDGRAVSALVWGTAPPEVVLLHGGAQNAHTWDTVALALDRPLVAVDLPGHGHSDHREDHRYWPDENARAIAAVLDEIVGVPVPVVGMSLGGLSAIALADGRPDLVPDLTLVDVTPGVDRQKASGIVEFVRGPETFATFEEILDRTIAFHPHRSESSLRRGVIHNARQLPDGTWTWRHDLLRHEATPADAAELLPGLAGLWDVLGAHQGSLALVRGEDSPVVSDADVAELLRRRPDVDVAVVPGAGHSIQGDRPLELARILAARLDAPAT